MHFAQNLYHHIKKIFLNRYNGKIYSIIKVNNGDRLHSSFQRYYNFSLKILCFRYFMISLIIRFKREKYFLILDTFTNFFISVTHFDYVAFGVISTLFIPAIIIHGTLYNSKNFHIWKSVLLLTKLQKRNVKNKKSKDRNIVLESTNKLISHNVPQISSETQNQICKMISFFNQLFEFEIIITCKH